MTIELTSKLVGTLRERTGLPLMKCKKALADTVSEANTTEEAWIAHAIEHLRKSGAAAVDKFAGRETPSGKIGMVVTPDCGVLVQLGCQTDFVANSDVFGELVSKVLDHARGLIQDNADAAFKDVTKPLVEEAITKLGENIVISKSVKLVNLDGVVAGYCHGGVRAAIVSGTGDASKLRQVAMHIVAANPEPVALVRAQVSVELIAKEKEIVMALPEVIAKPAAIQLRMIEGKINRFYAERTLLEQEMLLDNLPKETVGAYCARNGLIIKEFIRYSIDV
jgi:elongation factor Ts